MDLLHSNIFYLYLAGCLSNSIMYLFFQIQGIQLLVVCMYDLEYMATLNYALLSISLSDTFKMHLFRMDML